MAEKEFKRFERKDIWREGKWLDLWSVVHFFSGISLAFGLYFLHLGAAPSVLLALILLTTYEMWEIIVEIEETSTNRFMDVVVGLVSFLPSYFFILPHLPKNFFLAGFVVVLCSTGVLSAIGWYASKKAAVFEARMRDLYLFERTRFSARRARRLELQRKKQRSRIL